MNQCLISQQQQSDNGTEEKKSDFVQCLSYDAVSTIFALCSFRDCVRFTQVSSCWRSFLLGWPGMWENLTDTKCNYAKLLALASSHNAAAEHSRHVRRVDIQDKDAEEQNSVLEYLWHMKCCALDYLRISCDSDAIQKLKNLLEITGSSLISLDLRVTGDTRYVRVLAAILKYCNTRLNHLKYRHDYAIRPLTIRLDGRALPRHPLLHITSLNIACTMEMCYLQRIIALLPNLKNICINEDMIHNMETPGQVMELLCMSLTTLQKVNIYSGGNVTTVDRSITTTVLQSLSSSTLLRQQTSIMRNDYDDAHRMQQDNMEEEEQKMLGLRSLVLQNRSSRIDSDISSAILRTHHSTLEELYIIKCWVATLSFPPLVFPNMREIRLHGNILAAVNDATSRDLFTMLQMSRRLEHVYMNVPMPFDHVLGGLQGQEHLRTLSLLDTTQSSLLNRMLLPSGWPQLQRLSIYGARTTWMNHQQLQHITNLASAISDSPCLEMIDIDIMLVVADATDPPSSPSVMEAIGNLENLRYLRIQASPLSATGAAHLNHLIMQNINGRVLGGISAEIIITKLLQGNCRRSLRKLCLLDISTWTDAVLDAIVRNLTGRSDDSRLTHLQLGYPSPRLRNNRGNPMNQRDTTVGAAVTPDGIRRLGQAFVGKRLRYLGFRELWDWPAHFSYDDRLQIQVASKEVQELLTEDQVVVEWGYRCSESYLRAFGDAPLDPCSSEI
ncbi:hypothetical protein BDB00DRAFT_876959 [Zychaea mexicana]|uniref:uncharacterized protein n=1 Tax=Zychaea mexicana TaxID=64656 RepID=UPI0022FE21CA|nr:uncharacterized protein BDB00DRAFT_876959 [Zychaea mexicana]KAI9488893.1 hypothetical protein BDB00DRAFT_876959 [Zychaea mexicana]